MRMNHEPVRRGLTWGEWILAFLAILVFAGSPLSAKGNPPQVARLLDLASSGGYSRKDWNELARELNAIPVSEIPEVANAAAQWAGTLPTEAQATVFVAIFNRSKITNPRSLLEPMLSLPPGRDRNLAVARVLQQWSNENFSAARDWLSKQPQGPDSGLFLTSLTVLLADKDPELLLSLFDKMPDGDEKKS